jgi:large subunit ribosomal protein LP2
MKIVAAYLLAVLGGNENPGKSDIKKILSSVGSDAEESQIDNLLKELDGKNVFDVISQGKDKLASVPTGGAVAVAGGAAAETKEEEKEDEKEEEESEDMGFGGLF